MQRQTRRINSYIGPSWVYLTIWLLMMTSSLGQYASLYGNIQAYGYNPNQYQLNYAQQQYQAAAQSIWSGAPIVVTDNANDNLEQQYVGYNRDASSTLGTAAAAARAARRQQTIWGENEILRPPLPTTPPPPPPPHLPSPSPPTLQPFPTRAANHNYDNVAGYVPGYFYQPSPPTLLPSSTHQSELERSEARLDEEQVVHIGGSRSLATNHNNYNRNYLDSAEAQRRQDYVAKYLQHYADYLRKYPQRLKPIYNTGQTPYNNDK